MKKHKKLIITLLVLGAVTALLTTGFKYLNSGSLRTISSALPDSYSQRRIAESPSMQNNKALSLDKIEIAQESAVGSVMPIGGRPEDTKIYPMPPYPIENDALDVEDRVYEGSLEMRKKSLIQSREHIKQFLPL